MIDADKNIAYLVRGEPYRLLSLIPDGLFAKGPAFNPNSLYNRRRLVVPGRFVMGDFEGGGPTYLILKDDTFFIDRTPETLRRYEEDIIKGRLKPELQWYVSDDDLHAIVDQLSDHILSLRRCQPIQDKPSFKFGWTVVPEPAL